MEISLILPNYIKAKFIWKLTDNFPTVGSGYFTRCKCHGSTRTPRPCCPGGKPLPFPCTYMPLEITEAKDSCEIILLKEILGIDELQMDLILHS